MYRNKNNKLLFKPPLPIKELRNEAKKQLEALLISFKAKNKVVTRNKNKIKVKDKTIEQIALTPRGQLHKETIYGKRQQYVAKEEKIGSKFSIEKIKQVAKQSYREALLLRLLEFNGEPKKAFGGKNALSKNPVYIDDAKTITVPEKVKIVNKETNYTIRKDITHELKIEKVIDVGIRKILEERLKEYDGDKKKAFSNLNEKPIWLNKERGICVKRVKINGVSNVEALHYKKDHNGILILDSNGNKQAVGLWLY